MKCLAVSRSSARVGGRRIREVCFEDRSSLPASAACVVASGARETLGALLTSPVHLRYIHGTDMQYGTFAFDNCNTSPSS